MFSGWHDCGYAPTSPPGAPAFPVTIYYAFKQSDTKGRWNFGTGWETFLEAVLRAGFTLTGTWPMRTERDAQAINLASGITLLHPTSSWCAARAMQNILYFVQLAYC